MKNPLSSLPFFHGSIIYLHLVFTLQGKKFNNLSKVTKIMNIKDSHHACLQSLEPNGSPSSPNVSETEARGEGVGGEGNRQLGTGVAARSPEANEGGFKVEERQGVIMLMSR